MQNIPNIANIETSFGIIVIFEIFQTFVINRKSRIFSLFELNVVQDI